MTLFIIILLAAVLLVIGITQIKKTKANQGTTPGGASGASGEHTQASPNTVNPGSKPDGDGTNKGNGNAAMSSGKQG